MSSNDSASLDRQLCQPCRLAPPAFEKAAAFGVYQGELRSLIHLLKYEGVQPIAQRMGRLLAQAVRMSRESLATEPLQRILVIPVPLHRIKRRERGFNQAELLARAAISQLRCDPSWNLQLTAGILERRKATVSQAGLTPHQRRQNLRGAFFVAHPERLSGQHVLLVDDVYTTGATARACSRILMAAGAASVRVATAARAQREGVALWDAHFLRPDSSTSFMAPGTHETGMNPGGKDPRGNDLRGDDPGVRH